jgi:hypothetical protein
MATNVKDIPTPGSSQEEIPEVMRQLLINVRQTLEDLGDQLNTRAQLYSSTDGKIPTNLNRGDIFISSYKGRIRLLIKNAKGFDVMTAAMLDGLAANATNFVGLKVSAAVPALTEFPNPNDWGFHFKTTATIAFQICYNYNGVLKLATLA